LKKVVLVAAVALSCSKREVPPGTSRERGQALYRTSCSPCHGERGDGQGPAASRQPTRPRSFLRDSFRSAAAPGALPSDERFLQVIHDGLPDSSMPSFSWMSDEERRAVLTYVKEAFLSRRRP
jgi:mono/diheme cytochrome c family protein